MKYNDLSVTILSKMVFDEMIGGKHTSAESIKRGLPSHIKGDVDKALKSLVKSISLYIIQHLMECSIR